MLRKIGWFLLLLAGMSGVAQTNPQRVALFKPTLDLRGQARIQAMLSATTGAPTIVNLRDDWSPFP